MREFNVGDIVKIIADVRFDGDRRVSGYTGVIQRKDIPPPHLRVALSKEETPWVVLLNGETESRTFLQSELEHVADERSPDEDDDERPNETPENDDDYDGGVGS